MKGLYVCSLSSVLGLFVVATSLQAATPFDGDVPVEVVSQVLGALQGGQAQLFEDAPAGFPPFELPNGMSMVAGIDQGYQQIVILKSRFDWQAANALAYGMLLDAGWQLVPMPGMQMPQTGFIDPYQPVPQTQLCHDQYGTMQINGQSGLGATYMNLRRNVPPQGMPVSPCDGQQQAMGGAQSPAMQQQMLQRLQQQQQMQQYVPRLVMPNTDGMSAPMGGGNAGGGGSQNEWEVRAVLSGSWNLRRVYEYFADQIAEQDWKRDARVVGDTMASGSWTKTVDGDVELIGNLNILVTDDNNYDLRFRLIRKGAPQGQGIGTLIVRDPPVLGIRGIAVP